MLLEAHQLTADLPGHPAPRRVLDGLELTLGEGELVDVAGPSGSGKSTLLRALARLLPGATGSLALGGRPASEFSAIEWRSAVALQPQKPALLRGSVADNLLLPWRLKARHASTPPDAAQLDAALLEVGLDDVGLDRPVSRLSVGQQARVALLRVVLTNPRVLLLDEPDANLDEVSADAVARVTVALTRAGTGVVRVRHQRPDGRADRRLVLSNGRLAEVDA